MNLSRDKRQERRSLTSEDTLNSPNVRHPPGSVTKPDILHIIGVSEEVEQNEFLTHRKKGVSQEADKNKDQTKFVETNGSGTRTEPVIGANGKSTFCIRDNSLLQLNNAAPEHSASPAYISTKLLGNGAANQNLPLKEGSVRPKIMRTVSQDDYLLARGANPRTGVVTPSVHSGSSSADDQELCKSKGLSQTARWRLKGDEWVSLDLDEPSPLLSPAFDGHGRQGLTLPRTPPKLAHGSGTHTATHDHRIEQKRIDGLKPTANNSAPAQQTEQQDNGDFPSRVEHPNRTHAPASPAKLYPSRIERSGKNTGVRRKPLGTPASKPSADNPFHGNGRHEASTETVITRTRRVEELRSSSMPTPRKFQFFRPEDVGKALPALPGSPPNEHGDIEEDSRPPTMTFLGLRSGDGINEVLDRTKLHGHHWSEKCLPCPPTKDTLFQSHRWESTNTKRLPAMTIPMGINKYENQQHATNPPSHLEERGSALASKRRIPPRHSQIAQMMDAERGAEQKDSMKIHNPMQAKSSQPRPQAQFSSMSGQMTMRSTEGEEGGSEAPPSQSITIPTTTPITTAQTLPEDRLVSWSWRELPSPVQPGRQRATITSRPGMPERAEGTHRVPQVSLQKKPAERYQWRMTGTSDGEVLATSTPVEVSPEHDLIGHRPLRPSNRNTAGPGLPPEVAAENVTDADLRTRNCPYCQGPPLGARQHDMHGTMHTQGDLLAENIKPHGVSSMTAGFRHDEAEDHSGCSDCCVVGFHGSCPGHRPPSRTGSTSGFAGTLGAMKGAFRNSIRFNRRIRTRTSAGGSQEVETEEVAELETPMSWKMSRPVGWETAHGISGQEWVGGGHPKNDQQGKRVASNGSTSSVKGLEMPSDASIGAIMEAVIVPFGALKMWLRKNPQLPALMQLMLVKLVEMSKHVLDTTGEAYRAAYIYSKTGRIGPGKHTSASGLLGDCVKAVVYSLVLTAVAMMVARVLAMLAGAGSWLIWSLSWVAWISKAAGLGILW